MVLEVLPQHNTYCAFNNMLCDGALLHSGICVTNLHKICLQPYVMPGPRLRQPRLATLAHIFVACSSAGTLKCMLKQVMIALLCASIMHTMTLWMKGPLEACCCLYRVEIDYCVGIEMQQPCLRCPELFACGGTSSGCNNPLVNLPMVYMRARAPVRCT